MLFVILIYSLSITSFCFLATNYELSHLTRSSWLNNSIVRKMKNLLRYALVDFATVFILSHQYFARTILYYQRLASILYLRSTGLKPSSSILSGFRTSTFLLRSTLFGSSSSLAQFGTSPLSQSSIAKEIGLLHRDDQVHVNDRKKKTSHLWKNHQISEKNKWLLRYKVFNCFCFRPQ